MSLIVQNFPVVFSKIMGNQPSASTTSTQNPPKNISNQQFNPPSPNGSNSKHVYTKMSPEEYLEYQAFLKQKQNNSAPPNPPPNISKVPIPQQTTTSVLDKDILDKLNRKPQASLQKPDTTRKANPVDTSHLYATKTTLRSSIPKSISSLVEVPPPRPVGSYGKEFYSRPKPQLTSRNDHTSVKDDYQNLWAQRQQDVNQTRFSTLKSHGEVQKTQRHFEKSQHQRDKLKSKTNFDYLDSVDFDHIHTEADFRVCYRFLDIQLPTNKHALTDAFKKKAKMCHPDKGGDKVIFDRLKKAFIALLKKHHTDKDFHELQQSSRKDIEENYTTHLPEDAPLGRGEQFNLKKFHQLYEKHSLENNYDKGYEEWRKTQPIGHQDKANATLQKYKLNPKKFNKSDFNNAFQNLKEKVLDDDPRSKQLMKIEEPEALVSSSGGFSEIDQAPIGDFTTTSSGGIQGTDYKRAMTETYLVPKDSTNFKRKQFKNLDELEKDRENIRYTLNENETANFLAKKEQEEEEENQRLQRIRERDEMVKESYQNIHNLLGL